MRLIDADKIQKCIAEEIPLKYFMGRDVARADRNVGHIIDYIDTMPTIDPVKHGHWIRFELYSDDVKCSVCGVEALCKYADYEAWDYRSNYCLNCGALMMDEVSE